MAHSKETYINLWAVLVALLIVSVLGPLAGIMILTLVTAFGVALIKAYLVVVHFMHLPLDKKYAGYLLATCLAFMLLLFSFTAPDIMKHEGRNWVNTAAKLETQCTLLARADKNIVKADCKKLRLEDVVKLAKRAKNANKGKAPKTRKTPK